MGEILPVPLYAAAVTDPAGRPVGPLHGRAQLAGEGLTWFSAWPDLAAAGPSAPIHVRGRAPGTSDKVLTGATYAKASAVGPSAPLYARVIATGSGSGEFDPCGCGWGSRVIVRFSGWSDWTGGGRWVDLSALNGDHELGPASSIIGPPYYPLCNAWSGEGLAIDITSNGNPGTLPVGIALLHWEDRDPSTGPPPWLWFVRVSLGWATRFDYFYWAQDPQDPWTYDCNPPWDYMANIWEPYPDTTFYEYTPDPQPANLVIPAAHAADVLAEVLPP